MNKESLSWWLSLLFSGIVSYCFWLQMSQGRDQKYLFPEAIIAVMLSFTAVFGGGRYICISIRTGSVLPYFWRSVFCSHWLLFPVSG